MRRCDPHSGQRGTATVTIAVELSFMFCLLQVLPVRVANKVKVGKGNWGSVLFPLASGVCFFKVVPVRFFALVVVGRQQNSRRERFRLWPSTLNVVSWVSVQKC